MAAAWRRQREHMAARCDSGRHGAASRSEGFTLIELIVSIAIMAVVTTMTVVILTNFINVAGSTVRTGQAAERGQVAVARLDRYLRAAIDPSSAQGAGGVLGTSACWGNSSPAPRTITKTPTKTPPLYTVTSKLAPVLTVVAAHDFNVWFCGYVAVGPNAAPTVYELVLASTGTPNATGAPLTTKLDNTFNPAKTPQPCRQVDGTAKGNKGGYCTLELLDWSKSTTTKNATGNMTPRVTACNPGTKVGCRSTPTVVASIAGVWCDAYCQGRNGAIAEFPNATNTSLYPTHVAVACVNQKTAQGGCATATPPLLTYYQAPINAAGKAAPPPVRLSPFHCTATGCETGPALGSHTCTVTSCGTGTMLDLSGAAQAKNSTSTISTQQALTKLLAVSLAQLQLSVIAGSAQAAAPTGSQPPGVMLTDRVYLQNRNRTGGTSCSYQSAVSSLTPTAYWPLTDTGGKTAKPQVADLSGNGMTGLFISPTQGPTAENSVPGPLACSAASPGMHFSPATTAIKVPKKVPGPQDFSIVAWFRTKTPGGIVGFGNTTSGQSGFYTRLLYVGNGTARRSPKQCPVAGSLCWGVYNPATGGVHIASSPYKVDDGKWHMAVATVCGAASAGGPAACPTGTVGQYLWVDGNLAGYLTTSVKATTTYTGFWRLGELPNSGTWTGGWDGVMPFTGSVGQVAVIPRTLTPGQIQQLYAASGAMGISATATAKLAEQPLTAQSTCLTAPMTAAKPVMAYPLTTTTSSSAAEDIAPRGTVPGTTPPYQKSVAQNAAASGAVSFGQPKPGATPLCNPGATAASFNGGHLAVPTSATFAPNQMTVESWVNLKSFSDSPRLVANAHTDCTTTGFQLVIKSGGDSGFFQVGTGKSSSPPCTKPQGQADWSYAMTAGKWYFYVGTYDGHTVRAYLDGVQVAQAPDSGAIAPSGCGCEVSIGYNPANGTDQLAGSLADVAVYATALTAGQIAQQWYQAQSQVKP